MVSNVHKLIWQVIERYVLKRSVNDIAEDPRKPEERAKDYVYGQDVKLPGSPSLNKRIKKLPFKALDQEKTSACGAYAATHARKIAENSDNFPPVWYRTRSNYAGKGMFLKEVLKLAAKATGFPEPSGAGKLSEELVNQMALIDVYDNNRDNTHEYVQINPYDFSAVVEASNSGRPVIISFFSTLKEWTEEMIPTDTVYVSTAAVRHYVVVLPNSYHEHDGHEWVSVIDSSPAKGFALRHLRKDFLENRMYLGGGFYYPVSKQKAPVRVIPAVAVEYGERSEDVKNLQEFLYRLGLVQSVHRTGYYGNITAKAVLRWQLANITIMKQSELEALQGMYWGPVSIKTAKKIYQ